MTVEQTSLFAYKEVKPKISKRHKQILELFKISQTDMMLKKHLNNRQISYYSGLPINCVTPRCLELRDMGLLVKYGIDKDPKTNRLTKFWRLK